jgi:hypothetical protein
MRRTNIVIRKKLYGMKAELNPSPASMSRQISYIIIIIAELVVAGINSKVDKVQQNMTKLEIAKEIRTTLEIFNRYREPD